MDAFVRQQEGHIYWTNRVYIDVTPSTGLIGSTEDAARLAIAYLNTHALLSDESKALMLPSPGETLDQGERGWQVRVNGHILDPKNVSVPNLEPRRFPTRSVL